VALCCLRCSKTLSASALIQILSDAHCVYELQRALIVCCCSGVRQVDDDDAGIEKKWKNHLPNVRQFKYLSSGGSSLRNLRVTSPSMRTGGSGP